jgi:hypothetical protein
MLGMVPVCLCLANTRLLIWGFTCALDNIDRTEHGGKEKGRDFIRIGGLGGKVYQIAVHPRGHDYHCD